MRASKREELKSYLEEMRTVASRMISSEPHFLSSEQYRMNLANGHTIVREKLQKGGKDGSSVIIFPITKEGEVILTVEPRVFTRSTVGISFPAGYIERGEDSFTAAKRELQEETGYASSNWVPLGGFYQDSGCSAVYNQPFLAQDVYQVGGPKLDADEYIRHFTCSFEEVLELAREQSIEDSNALVTLAKVKEYRRRRYHDEI